MQKPLVLPVKSFALVALLALPWMLVVTKLGMEMCCATIGLSFLWHSYRTRQWQWAKEPFLLVCFVAWGWLTLVVTPLATTPSHSLPDALAWIRLPLLYAACRYWLLAELPARRAFAVSLMLLIGFIAVDVLWQYQTGVSLTGNPRTVNLRMTGPFTNPKAGLMMGKLFLPTLMVTLLTIIIPGRRYALGALFFLVLASLAITGDISATVATGLGIAVMLVAMMIKLPRWRLPGIALMLIGAAGSVALVNYQPWLQDRFDRATAVVSDYRHSDYGVIAYAALAVAKEHSWHGVGVHSFRDTPQAIGEDQGEVHANHPHNYYLEWWAEAGIPGLFLFVTMIGLLTREAWLALRAAQGVGVLVPAAALGVIAQHYFPIMGMQSYFTNWPAMLQWLPLALMFALVPVAKPLRFLRP